MLYLFNEKVYVKPFSNMVVEVEITKKNDEYDVKATNKKIELNEEQKDALVPIELEEAYKYLYKIKNQDIEKTEKTEKVEKPKKEKSFFKKELL